MSKVIESIAVLKEEAEQFKVERDFALGAHEAGLTLLWASADQVPDAAAVADVAWSDEAYASALAQAEAADARVFALACDAIARANFDGMATRDFRRALIGASAEIIASTPKKKRVFLPLFAG